MRLAKPDDTFPAETAKVLLVRYDLNQSSAVPVTPTQFSSLSSKTEWVIVSKAADKSRRTRTVQRPTSELILISLRTFKSAVSVLW